jgi:hypothetical protein
MDPTEAQIHFTAIGRKNSEPDEEFAVSYEGLFSSANKPFTIGGRNDSDGGFCFLTGQRKGICQCAECANRRAKR